MTDENTDNGHWIYPDLIDINEWFGFIYRIVELDTGRQYIGKKQFWSKVTKPPLKGRKNKRRSRKESKMTTHLTV